MREDITAILDVATFEHNSLLAAATALLWNVLRLTNVESQNPIVGSLDSIQLGSGNTWGDVNKFLMKFKQSTKTIVGGAIASVGVTGWMQGGGHGDFALEADFELEADF